jgi:hypothetical protein
MSYFDKEYSFEELDNLHTKAKEYCESRDSQYSLLGKVGRSIGRGVVNTASSNGKFLGSKRLGRKVRNIATSKAQRKLASGASGMIAKKTGMDKQDVSNVINSAGQMTGATRSIRNGIAGGGIARGVTKGIASAGNTVNKAKAASGEMANHAKDYAKRAQQRMKNLTSNSTSPNNTSAGNPG